MTYTEVLAYLAALGHELHGVKFDLANMRLILDALDHPERKWRSVLVAGTNGKGSTCAMLASVLTCSGYRTGLYTSPHLVRVNERIRVDGRDIADDDFAAAFCEVERAVRELLAKGTLARTPSFFEFLTATAFVHFTQARVQFAILEVGMGGRLDATNTVEPEVAVITNVDLDHTEYLGGTLSAIAFEKAGVLRAGRPAISGCVHPEAGEVVRRRAAELGAEFVELPSFGRLANVGSHHGCYGFDLSLDGTRYSSLKPPLRGRFQVENATAAAAAAWKLAERGWKIPPECVTAGIARARWPGRLEVCAEQPLTLLDGAHNPAAARAVADFVRAEVAGPITLVYASMRDKAIEEIAGVLFPLASQIYLTRPAQPRAARPEEILARIEPLNLEAQIHLELEPAEALKAARSATPVEGAVLAAGSLFLVGALKAALGERPFE
jgi:dihydrofolate synthase / folylpolyglutamate synthase